jgi:hypothetical protein
MNTFNRIVMVVLILVLLAVAVLVLTMPWEVARVLRQSGEFLSDAIYDDTFYFTMIAVAAVVAFLLLVLLWLELRRRRRKTVRIKTEGRGRASLGVESVEQSLEYRIDELAGVRDVNTRIKSRGRDVDVNINLNTSPSVNVPVLTQQIVDLAHDIIEGQLGVKIHGKVHIDVKHEPYPRGTMPPTAPLGEEPLAARPRLAQEGEVPREEPRAETVAAPGERIRVEEAPAEEATPVQTPPVRGDTVVREEASPAEEMTPGVEPLDRLEEPELPPPGETSAEEEEEEKETRW